MHDIEDSQFWMAMHCFMRAVIPALWANRYCDVNIPTVGMFYYFVIEVDYVLLSFQPIWNDEGSFGQMNGELCDGDSNKSSTNFGQSKKKFLIDDELR